MSEMAKVILFREITPKRKDEQHIVMVGNLEEGWNAYGPFDSFDDAVQWADVENRDHAFWVMKLIRPEPKPIN